MDPFTLWLLGTFGSGVINYIGNRNSNRTAERIAAANRGPAWFASNRQQYRNPRAGVGSAYENIIGSPMGEYDLEAGPELGSIEMERIYGELGHMDDRRRANEFASDEFDWQSRAAERDYGYFEQGLNAQIIGQEESTNRLADDHIERLEGLGLTPQEIMGAPGAGRSSGGSGGPTIGNGPSMAAGVQASSSTRAEMIRAATATDVAGIQAAAQVQSAKIGAAASLGQTLGSGASQLASTGISADATRDAATTSATPGMLQAGLAAQLQPHQIEEIQATIERIEAATATEREATKMTAAQTERIESESGLIIQTLAQDRVRFEERWAMTFSKMSPENGVTSALASLHGLDLEDVLKGVPGQDRDALKAFIGDVQSTKSILLRELLGADRAVGAAAELSSSDQQDQLNREAIIDAWKSMMGPEHY